MSREYYSVSEILVQYPGHQALILQSPAGETLLLKLQDRTPEDYPEGKWCLLGTVGPNG